MESTDFKEKGQKCPKSQRASIVNSQRTIRKDKSPSYKKLLRMKLKDRLRLEKGAQNYTCRERMKRRLN